jgi:Fe-S-cluster-containing dehydrogenase component
VAKQLGFLVNLAKCVGCRGCDLACRNENRLEHLRYRQVQPIKNEENEFWGFLSLACNHCRNPECMRVCKAKCYSKRRDGVVLHNSTRCIGCRTCIGACPFKVPQINPQSRKIIKCNFCSLRMEQGLEPACAAACIPGALKVIDLLQPLGPQVVESTRHFAFSRLTQPSVRFILPLPTRCYWCNDKAVL